MEKYFSMLKQTVRGSCSDADQEVRTAARHLFWTLHAAPSRVWGAAMDTLLGELDEGSPHHCQLKNLDVFINYYMSTLR